MKRINSDLLTTRQLTERLKQDGLDFDYQTVKTWKARPGYPQPAERAKHQGQPDLWNYIDVLRVLTELRGRKQEEQDDKARKTRIEADILALELAEKEGKLVSTDEVKTRWSEEGRKLRDNLLTIPARVAPLCVALDQAAIREIVMREIQQVIDGLAGAPEN